MRCIAIPVSLLFAAAIAAAGSAFAACEAPQHLRYGAPVTLKGVLAEGSGQHEAQGPFKYTYLTLAEALCVDAAPGDDEFNQSTPEPVKRVQVAGDALDKAMPMGTPVEVKGTLFGAHTMWHAEDVLIDAEAVTQQ